MEFAIASDHSGVKLKNALISFLKKEHYSVLDLGERTEDSVDYPDYAKKVVSSIEKKEVSFGILICGTGIGMSMVANRYDFIRGALVQTLEQAKLSREHNDANVLCLGARILSFSEAIEILNSFINTKFSGEERHIRRLKKFGYEG